MPAPIPITLTELERKEIEKAISSSISPVRLIKRAKAILLAADDVPSYQIAQQLNVSKDSGGSWRKRYSNQRFEGIVHDRPRTALFNYWVRNAG